MEVTSVAFDRRRYNREWGRNHRQYKRYHSARSQTKTFLLKLAKPTDYQKVKGWFKHGQFARYYERFK